MSLESYRFIMVGAAGFSIALNAFVAFQWTRSWIQVKDPMLRKALRGPALYPMVATVIGLLNIYWRILDDQTNRPFNPGDVTSLVPIFGFMVAAWVSLGNYARVEQMFKKLRQLEGGTDETRR